MPPQASATSRDRTDALRGPPAPRPAREAARRPAGSLPAARDLSFPSFPGRRRQEPENLGERGLEPCPLHDDVDHPVLEKELGTLEPRRQFLLDRLLDGPRPGEPAWGARFRGDGVPPP